MTWIMTIPRRTRARRGRVIDRQYLLYIRSLPCTVCWSRNVQMVEKFHAMGLPYVYQSSRTEAAHVGVRGLGQKSSDRETIPLCREHHRLGPHSIHRLGKHFWEHHGIDKDALIAELNRRYGEAA